MVVTENHVVAMEEGGLKNNPKYMRTPSNGGVFLSSVLVWTGWGMRREADCGGLHSASPTASFCTPPS